MSRNDFKNSEVREVPKDQYDASKSKYMEAYSFIMSWGWRRECVKNDDEGKVYKWKLEDYAVDTVYEAASIQRLRILTNAHVS